MSICKCTLNDNHDLETIVAALRCMRAFYIDYVGNPGSPPASIPAAESRISSCTKLLREYGD